MELTSFLGSVSSWYPSQSTCVSRKPRQVLQTLLTMYRCSSRVLAEPEAGLPTKCRSTDHICCFETSQFALWHPLKLAYCLLFFFLWEAWEESKDTNRYVVPRALAKENFVLRVERLLANSSVRRSLVQLQGWNATICQTVCLTISYCDIF